MSHSKNRGSSIDFYPFVTVKIQAQERFDWSEQANMYKHFFGLQENPFNVNPDPRYLFLTSQTQEALDELTYGIQARKGLILLTGEVGTGKTTLINRLLDWLHLQKMPTAFIFNSHLETSHLFDFILADFGIPFDARLKGNALMRLNQWLLERYRAGETPVMIVDEAQGLPDHVLEEIRMLLNLETPSEKLLQIVLAGQPELEARLKRPELRQIKQRITIRCSTAALTLKETHDYIRTRLHIAGASGKPVFASESVDAVHFYSRGIPRVINLLCEHALIHAFVDQVQPVPVHIVREAAREFQFDDIKPVAPLIHSGTALDSNFIAMRSPFLHAPVSVPAATALPWKENPGTPAACVSLPFAAADVAHNPAKEAVPPALASELIPDLRGDLETPRSLGVQAAVPVAPGPRRIEANRPSELAEFFADLRIQFGSELPIQTTPLALPPLLHLVEEKEKTELLRSSRPSRISSPQNLSRLAIKVDATKLSPHRSILLKIPAMYSLSVAWSARWWNRFQSTLRLLVRAQWASISPERLERSLQLLQWCYSRCLARWDRCLIAARSIDWPERKAALYRWLQQPWDPTQLHLPNSRLFETRRKFSYKKM
jgi:general secretion pathway protein A